MIDGSERDIFSVRENNQGGLTITTPKTTPVKDSGVYEIVRRVSIHESLQSKIGGFEIKHTVKKSDDTVIADYAYVAQNSEYAMLHTFGQILPNQFLLPDTSYKKSLERIIVTENYKRGSLFYTVIVSRNNFEPTWLEGVPLKTIYKKFSKYTLIVSSGIFWAMPMRVLITVTTQSKPPRINGQIVPWPLFSDAPEYPISPLPSHLPFVIGQMVDDLATLANHLASLMHWDRHPVSGLPCKLSPEEIKKYLCYDYYYSDPSETVLTNRLQAHANRMLHPPSGLWLPSTDANEEAEPDLHPDTSLDP